MRDAETNTWPLPIAVVGCDFRRASSRHRSKLVLDDDEAVTMARELQRTEAADGFADLNTCNRNEWIASTYQPDWTAELLRDRMRERLAPGGATSIEPYTYTGDAAARHLLRVALGQESLVAGERQVAGQLFRALETARARGTASRTLNGLGSIAGRTVRRADRWGLLSSAAKGVHCLALNTLRERFEPRQGVPVAVIGLGEIGRRMLGLLQAEPWVEPVACNRSTRRADDGVRPLAEIKSVLAEVEAAVVCTSARQPLIHAGLFGQLGDRQALLLIDLGIPEQVSGEALPEGVERVNLDHLQASVGPAAATENRDARADELIEQACHQFRAYCREPEVMEILDAVHQCNRRMVSERIPDIVSSRFADLPQALQERLQVDLRGIFLGHMHEVYGSMKSAAQRDGGAQQSAGTQPEPESR